MMAHKFSGKEYNEGRELDKLTTFAEGQEITRQEAVDTYDCETHAT